MNFSTNEIILGGYCVISVVIVAGLLLWYLHQRQRDREKTAREEWPNTQGRVYEVRTKRITIRGGIFPTHIYEVYIRFAYRIGDKDYRTAKSISTDSLQQMEDYCFQFAEGTSLKILYNPRMHDDIVIDLGEKLIP